MTSPATKICSICLGSINTSQGSFTATCHHSFHFICITNTFAIPNPFPICPLCQPLPNYNAPLPNAPPSVPPSAPQIPKLEPEPVQFSDDDPLLEPSPPSSTTTATVGLEKVTINAVPERDVLAASESAPQFTVLIGLKAPPLPASSQRGAPVDLVTVLDVSGSMKGTKLDLVKRAVNFVIDELGPSDRLSIVSFSNQAWRIFRLTRMTEAGRASAKLAVNSLVVIGNTNIVEGLKKGARVLEERSYKNPVASIVFLSDGIDNCNHRPFFHLLPPSIYPANRLPHQQEIELFPVHAFGFGTDHDAVTMHAISDASGGTFSFIESYEMVQGAFASCIGGLLSVVTQGLRLSLRSGSNGVVMKSIPSGRYPSEIADQGSKGTIHVGDLYADEEKEFLINLSIPIRKTSLLDIVCSYIDVVSEKETVEIESVEIRRARKGSPSDTKVKLEVDRQRNRLHAAESIAEAQKMAESGDVNGARDLLAKGRTDILGSSSAQAGDDMCVWLEEDMKETERRMGSAEQYNKEGRAYALAGMSSHGAQRATTKGKKVAGAERRYSPYSTKSMALMVVKAEQLSDDEAEPIIKKEPEN
ncbi:hypothetical protein ABFX02_06G185000 [Erythranthe guttata]